MQTLFSGRTGRTIKGLLLIGLTLILAVGCSAAVFQRSSASEESGAGTASSGGKAGSGPAGVTAPRPPSLDMAQPPAAPAASGGSPGVAESKGNGGDGDGLNLPSTQSQVGIDRMIIYTTTIALTVEDVGQAVDQVTRLTQEAGGFLAGSSIRQEGEFSMATLTLRVPSVNYNDTMTALRRLGVKVMSEQGQAKDVTEEFSDLDAQVRNLQVAEAQLQELMKKATTIDEILRVQTQLNSVRGQIERLKGRMNFLQRNADLATITVTLSPVGAARARTQTGGWDPLRTVREAWDDSLEFVRFWADLGIRVAVFSWWLIPPALILWAAWATFRSRRRPAAQPSES